jgi:UDP-glucose 4-epimerase
MELNEEMDDISGELKNTTVVVTGGGGFIGSHLTERLVNIGADVIILDDFSSGHEESLTAIRDRITVIGGDIRNRELVREALENASLVFHLAANADVPRSVQQPRHDFDVNANGTQIILEESKDSDVDRVVFASSAAVYGHPQYTPIDEDHPLEPVSPYGASKLAGERLALAYNKTYDINVSILRIFNTYGPRQPRYVMFDFLEKLEEDPESLAVLGSGQETRTFVYIADTVDALLTVGTHPESNGEVFNIGGKQTVCIYDLATLMAERYYEEETDVYTTGEKKPGDITELTTDSNKISAIGVETQTELRDGLDALYEWYQSKEVNQP